MNKWRIITKSAIETEELGRALGQKLSGGKIIELISDLGGGKTTLAKGIASGLGVKENVSSPTFTISKIYQGTSFELHHYDFYRLKKLGIMNEELKEVLDNIENITVVEWAGEAHSLFPKKRTVRVELLGQENENHREITMTFPEDLEHIAMELGAEKC